MAVNYRETPAGQLQAIDGIRLFVGQAGIKKPQHDDLTLMLLSDGSTVGAVFTQNRFCAAPVRICKQHLFDADGVRALVINTGNANAGTGEEGLNRAMAVCEAAAEQAGCAPTQVLPFSTGVILEPLPADKIIAALPKMRPAGWADAARAIMTTDTVPKSASREGKVGEKHTVRATGIAKGSGMNSPKPSSATAKARPNSSPSKSATPKAATKHAGPPMPSPAPRWSKPPSSPLTPTSAACWPPSAVPASIWTATP